MTQPSQGFLLQLTNPLVRKTELSAQLTQGAWWNSIQAVAGDNDLSQSVRELEQESQQCVVDQRTVETFLKAKP